MCGAVKLFRRSNTGSFSNQKSLIYIRWYCSIIMINDIEHYTIKSIKYVNVISVDNTKITLYKKMVGKWLIYHWE